MSWTLAELDVSAHVQIQIPGALVGMRDCAAECALRLLLDDDQLACTSQ